MRHAMPGMKRNQSMLVTGKFDANTIIIIIIINNNNNNNNNQPYAGIAAADMVSQLLSMSRHNATRFAEIQQCLEQGSDLALLTRVIPVLREILPCESLQTEEAVVLSLDARQRFHQACRGFPCHGESFCSPGCHSG